MNRPFCAALLLIAWTLSLATFAAGATKHDFQTGKLLDIGSSERVIDGTVYKSALFTVQIADLVYTGRGARIMRRTKDVGHGLIVGDPVQVAIDGESLILMTPDRKELKATIVKRARAKGE